MSSLKASQDLIVALNARAAGRPELGGVERWAKELAIRLPKLRPNVYRLLEPPRGFAYRAGQVWEQFVLPVKAKRIGANLLYSPANLAPLFSSRNVVTVFDTAVLRSPDWYSRAYVAWHRWLMPRVLERAIHVVTASHFARSELIEVFQLQPGKVSVVQPGVAEQFSPNADSERARTMYGLTRPYVLTVGSLTARKNLAALSKTAQLLEGAGFDLVAVGGRRPQFREEDVVPGIRQIGYVPDSELPGLYAGAAVFVLPSLYEGFGLPCLEAMASGTPVVASNRAALPEACGDAAVLVDPEERGEFASAVEQVLSDTELAAKLRQKGIVWSANFSWQQTAEELDSLLIRTANSI